MLEKEFASWCQKLFLSPEAVNLIETIRTAPPSRRVRGRAGNVSGTYPSKKMGLTIQFESHKVELWAIYQMEHDSEVQEFYDQPPPFLIRLRTSHGSGETPDPVSSSK
jgi:putative transposase